MLRDSTCNVYSHSIDNGSAEKLIGLGQYTPTRGIAMNGEANSWVQI